MLVEENLDPDVLAAFIGGAVKVIDSLFGPAFTRMISRYALEFESQKTGEEPPENILSVDEVINYLKERRERYPKFYNSLIYGIAKTEKMFEGSTASGAKNLASNAIKKMIEEVGLLNEVKGKIPNIYEALMRFIEITKSLKAASPQRIVKESEKVILLEMEGCPWKDACEAMEREGITRLTGDPECVVLIANSAGVSLVSGKPVDYKLEIFNEPNCKGRIFEI